MKVNLKRKNYYLDEAKIRRVRGILGVKTETEAIDAALKSNEAAPQTDIACGACPGDCSMSV